MIRILFLIVILVRTVSSSGTLEIEMLNIPDGSSKVFVCVKEVYATVWKEPCTFGQVSADLTNSNVVKIPFTFRWPGAFTLVVSVLGRNDDIELSRFGVSDEWIAPSQQWRTHTKVRYRVMCHQHYHGEDCAIFCRDRDDAYGHYRCNSKGIKECLEGWKGADCDKPQCRSGCNEQHGFCSRPDECQCRPGWTGPRCDQCVEYPGCVHGYCVSPWQCICNRNWGGILCDQDLNYCGTHQPCLNEGQCENVAPDQYRCKCRKGFAGINCEIVLDSCATFPCVNGGTCISSGNNSLSFSCVCPAGWTGHRCEHNVNECTSRPCYNGGTCIDLIADYHCLCPQGWTGRQCDIDVDECNSLSPCIHALRCLNLMGSFNCECVHGFTGQLCEVNVNECASGPCMNGGTCIDLVGEHQCVCPIGYTGSNCEKVDESVCNQGGGRGFWEVAPGDVNNGCGSSRLCHCDSDMRVKCLCIFEEKDVPKCFDSAFDLIVEFENGINFNKTLHHKVCSLLIGMINDSDDKQMCCDIINENTIRIGTIGSYDDTLKSLATKVTKASLRSIRVRSVSLSLTTSSSIIIIIIITISSIILFLSIVLLLYSRNRSSASNVEEHHNEPVRRVHNNLYSVSTRPISMHSNNPNNSPTQRANNEQPASAKL